MRWGLTRLAVCTEGVSCRGSWKAQVRWYLQDSKCIDHKPMFSPPQIYLWAKQTSSTWVVEIEPVSICIPFILFMKVSFATQCCDTPWEKDPYMLFARITWEVGESNTGLDSTPVIKDVERATLWGTSEVSQGPVMMAEMRVTRSMLFLGRISKRPFQPASWRQHNPAYIKADEFGLDSFGQWKKFFYFSIKKIKKKEN